MSEPPKFDAVKEVKDLAQAAVADGRSGAVERFLERYNKLCDNNTDDLHLAMMDELIRLGAQRAIAKAAMAVDHKTENVDLVQAGTGPRVRRAGPYGWQLPNGSSLNMATVADIDDAIVKHKVKALAHAGWVKFYAIVKAKMIAAKVHSVGELFSEPELVQLSSTNGITQDHLPTAEGG